MSQLLVVKSTEKIFKDAEGRESSSFTVKLAPNNSLGIVPKADKCWYVRTPVKLNQGEILEVDLNEFDEEVVDYTSPNGVVKMRWLSPKA